MTASWIASPPVALGILLALGAGLYAWAGRRAARGPDAPGKHLPYACGEEAVPGQMQLSYGRFFGLALMFVVVHVGILVVATASRNGDLHLLATVYLLCVALCVDILTSRQGDRT